jgi:succinyl-diaminopimelate desuccinylase
MVVSPSAHAALVVVTVGYRTGVTQTSPGGSRPPARLDLTADPGALTAALCDIPSVSGSEREIADAVQEALTPLSHLTVVRDGDAVVARTALGHAERVVLAGHLDTVPIHENLPTRVQGSRLLGCGTCDMKSGVAIQLALAAAVPAPNRDVTYVFYDNEEVEAERNGLGRIARQHPEWLAADFAILLEPSGAVVEGGCQGTMRVEVRTHGMRAHSARSWKGDNAIHKAGAVLDRLKDYEPAVVEIDGLTYREGLNAVGIAGGVAGNVIPDLCTVTVNFRFAPSRSPAQAEEHLREVFTGGFEVSVVDVAPGALPGLTQPAAAAFVEAVGGQPRAKLGWTDVARFSAVGVPAVNYGPGDPSVAHMREEYVDLPAVRECYDRLHHWLTA